MSNYYTKGFIAGCLSAIILVIVMYILEAIGMGEPAFVGMYNATFTASPTPPGDEIIAALLFIISGGAWGLLYTLLVKHPTVLNGFLFGLLPTLWLWIAVNAYLDRPLFNGFTLKGLLLPIIFNMVIWGTFVGWYLSRNKAYRTNTAV